MKPKAMLTVKRRRTPMVAVIVSYSEVSGRQGVILAAEPLPDNFSMSDLEAAARRLVPQVTTHDVILPTGINV